jgi:hypothetical protein
MPVPWTVRLNLKLQKVWVPRSTQIPALQRKGGDAQAKKPGGEFSLSADELFPPGYLLAREILIQLEQNPSYEKMRESEFGQHATSTIMTAVWRQDIGFLKDFLRGFEVGGREYCALAPSLYTFMFAHEKDISGFRTVTEIYDFVTKDPKFGEFDFSNFSRLCREIGLPVKQ